MNWPLKSSPVPHGQVPFFNRLYLQAAGSAGPDPTISWTSEVAWQPVQNALQQHSDQSCMVNTSHLLVQAVGQAMLQHPEMNRRVVGRRIYEFQRCSVCLATRAIRGDEVNVVLVPDVNDRSTADIARFVWNAQLKFNRNASPDQRDRQRIGRLPAWLFAAVYKTSYWLNSRFSMPVLGRIDRLRESPVLVNDFSHPRFPAMIGYKPSRQPDESKPLNVTLGKPQPRVVMEGGEPVERSFAPLCVRADHRICDSFQLAVFISTLVGLLESASTQITPAQRQLLSTATNADDTKSVSEPIAA